MASSNNAKENLKIVKKTLMSPANFKKSFSESKACFSYDYKQYGSFENWAVAWSYLGDLPKNENIFHELIRGTDLVRPYLDIEWYSSKLPGVLPETVQLELKKGLIHVFENEWGFNLKDEFIFIASCHRDTQTEKKYSFRVVVSTKPVLLVFKGTNAASFLAKKMKSYLEEQGISGVVDTGVYKKSQNMRFVGHSKNGEFVPMQKINSGDNDLDFIITNVSTEHNIIEVPEQQDYLYRGIKKSDIDFSSGDVLGKVLEKVKAIHPSAIIERLDAQGFIQMNYIDRTEKCFCNDRLHDKIGFFSFIKDNLIYVGCHSGSCVDENNKKIIQVLGSLKENVLQNILPVTETEEFDVDHLFIKQCVYNDNLGMSDLFNRLFLEPKRIIWINDKTSGSIYFWSGKLWQEDEASFLYRLVATSLSKVLHTFTSFYGNQEDTEAVLSMDENTLKIANKLENKIKEGSNISKIIKFSMHKMNDQFFMRDKDRHPNLLSVKGAVVDLKTGIPRSCEPADLITKCLDISYDINANSDDWDSFVRQITSSEEGPDEELYNFMRWSIGYAAQGNPIKKIFYVFYGEMGYNGKSLFLNTIKNVLQFYAVAMDKSVVVSGHGKTAGSHSTELVQLENSRLGILSETSEDAVINDSQIKALTGITDKLSVREIYGKQREMTPTFVPFISTNHKLKINLRDQAMFERLLLIPFRLSFVDVPVESHERQNDPHLAEKFNNNKEGILKWIIDCSVFYHQNLNLTPPNIVMKAKIEYRKEMDNYAKFIEETFDFTGNKKDTLTMKEIIPFFKNYAIENGVQYDKKKSEKLIHDSLKQYYNEPKYAGIKFKET